MKNLMIISQMTDIRINVIYTRTQNQLFAGAKAILIQTLKDRMSNGVTHFLFLKKDGSVREAWGTLNKSLIEKHIIGCGESRELYATSAYFDVEKGAWRSFRWESIISIL